MYKIFLFLCFFFFFFFVIRFLCDSIFLLLLPYCSICSMLRWTEHTNSLFCFNSPLAAVCSTQTLYNVNLYGCEWVSECVCQFFFVYVISRSSSVRFRHKAQTPESREYKYFHHLVAISVVPLCSPTLWAGKKTYKHTHTHRVFRI